MRYYCYILTNIMSRKYEKGVCTCEHENGVTRKTKVFNQKVFHALYIIHRSLKPITPAMVANST